PGETGGPVDVVDDDGRALPMFLDHADILGLAVKRLRGKLDYSPVRVPPLPTEFTPRQPQAVHAGVPREPANKDSFPAPHVGAGGGDEREVVDRPGELYRLTRRSAT